MKFWKLFADESAMNKSKKNSPFGDKNDSQNKSGQSGDGNARIIRISKGKNRRIRKRKKIFHE